MSAGEAVQMAKAIEIWPIERLKPYERNARTHSPAQVAKIAASITEFGFTNPILVDGNDGIIAGHGRLMAAKQLGIEQVPVIELTYLTDAQRRAYIIADNKLAEEAGWDEEILAAELDELRDEDFDLTLTGFEKDELAGLIGSPDDPAAPYADGQAGGLADKFLVPPFSVLDARQGYWQDRKRAWMALGIRSEEGRDAKAFSTQDGGLSETTGTSIFDPVLCELAYRWFCPKGGLVLDPFAGGSVRGIVAAKLGRQYVGNDLRAEQVKANRAQADEIITGDDDPMPVWNCGDSRNIAEIAKGVEADFILTCPPYADLEIYSDNPADISTLGYDEFREAYRKIIAAACSLLKKDRFACVVVGEVRGQDGAYYNFVGDTIQAFLDAGLHYYNEGILVTAIGSLPLRAGKTFSASRKLGKTHQNILVFVKGDPKKATAACGEVEITLPEGMETGEGGQD